MTKVFTIISDRDGIRIDQYLADKLTDYSRSKIQNLIKHGHITMNGQRMKPSYQISEGEEFTCEPVSEAPEDLQPENIPIDIIYEDQAILVVNKPAGMVVHPGSGNFSGTLVNALLYHTNDLSQMISARPGIVHRLDKETSGVLVIAKTDSAHRCLSEQFASRMVQKTYQALVWGKIPNEGEITGNLDRHPVNRKAFAVTETGGRKAATNYRLQFRYGPLSHLELFPKTGRTHQLRVHLASIGHPIYADELYGGGHNRSKAFHSKYGPVLKSISHQLTRVALHAARLECDHPVTGDRKVWEVPIPEDMESALKTLKNEFGS